MTAVVPSIEPTTAIAGDSWTWQRACPDYMPADGWSLTYYFKNAAGTFTVACTTTGTNYLASMSATTTGAVRPGRYRWSARVTHATLGTFTVASGEIEVSPDPAADGNYDFRTTAQKVLAALEELAARRAQGRQQVSVDGVSMVFDSWSAIIQAKTYWEGVVEAEQNRDRVAKGQGSLRTIRARL